MYQQVHRISITKDKTDLHNANQINDEVLFEFLASEFLSGLYLKLKLDSIFPTPEKLINAMSLSYIVKAVTYETISCEDFQESIKKVYPLMEWDQMYEEYDAARESK